MSYKVGTRIKKVRGEINIGVTGRVVAGNVNAANAELGYDRLALIDQPYINRHNGSRIEAGSIGAVRCSDWEPIIPEGHQPSEYSYEELLEQLKEEQGEVA